jgi:uncharacterized protein (TIGR02271 family)
MSSTVTALYDTREEAGRALHSLQAEAPDVPADIYDSTPAGLVRLRGLDLSPDDRAACEEKLASGDYLLLARVGSDAEVARIVSVLERIADEDPGRAQWQPLPAATEAAEKAAPVIAEERVPLIEEELRIGTREVVRGGVRVRTRVEEVPVTEEIALLEELARAETRPASRAVSPQELEEAGLLRDRVIEIALAREEAVVTKEAFVREEVVIRKTTRRRVKQIHETVRRTEVETEELGADAAAGR